ncbi:MAG: molybdopterin molybdenumtransferase MoeA [Methylophilaceae bacterium]|nr:molybdopterin molybdenumtransferase MoeA [Methylophilaceae bacterium]
MSKKTLAQLAAMTPCDDYDPNSMSVAQAKQFIRQYLHPVQETERIAIRDALDRVCAQAIVSPINVPDYDNSAMDGYAFVHAELAQYSQLRIAGKAFAGSAYTDKHQPGTCLRIMTGAVVPADVDTVIAQEWVECEGENIRLQQLPPLGANIRRAGEDIAAGQTVFEQGHLFQVADIGLLASLGIAEVEVLRPLRVAFFSTGDELLDISQPLQAGKIYDSNRYTLFAILKKLGVQISDLGAIPDQADRLETTLLTAASAHDVVISSGGVSVGEADLMKPLLQQHGQVLFWKIAMKPGRPLAYGKIGEAHYFGLPGNPVAVMVTFYQFVQSALQILMGQSHPYEVPLLTVKLAQGLKKAKGRMEFQRGYLYCDEQGEWRVKSTGNQSSGVLSSMSRANCLIVLDEDCGHVEAGELVQVQLLKGLI